MILDCKHPLREEKGEGGREEEGFSSAGPRPVFSSSFFGKVEPLQKNVSPTKRGRKEGAGWVVCCNGGKGRGQSGKSTKTQAERKPVASFAANGVYKEKFHECPRDNFMRLYYHLFRGQV